MGAGPADCRVDLRAYNIHGTRGIGASHRIAHPNQSDQVLKSMHPRMIDHMGALAVLLVTAGIGLFIHKVSNSKEAKRKLSFKPYYGEQFSETATHHWMEEECS